MSKGTRREKQACDLYESAGYDVYSPQRVQFGDNDLFNLYDLVALRDDRAVTFCQVKSNSTQGNLKEFFEESAELLPGPKATAHFLVCFDREGWKLYTAVGVKYNVAVDERNETCDMGEHVTEYLGVV